MSLLFNEIKRLFKHAFCFSFILSLFCYIYFFGANPYTLYFITLVRCLNNEHEDNQEIQSKFDFEKMPCADDTDSDKCIYDEALPLEMRRLID